jgi:hypothetical protein
MKNFIYVFVLALLLGCSYSVYSSSMPHLKTISIKDFENRTDEYQLDTNLAEALSEDFIQDGRLRIVDFTPDCILQGKILDYSNKLATYGSNGVDEYEVRIMYSITFTDLVKNKVIWETNNLVFSQLYSNDENSDIKTEDEAIKKIEQDLFDRIIRESLEDW